MNAELLDVVDDNDQVIDCLPRHQIHAAGIRHRAVHILVFNQIGEFFLQKRSMKKDLNKGLWDTSAAGHVDAGEDYVGTAIREAKEELGVDLENKLQPLFKLSPEPDLGMEFIQVYQSIHNGPFVLNAEETDEGLWFSTKDISTGVLENDPTMTKSFKIIWTQYILCAVTDAEFMAN